MSDADRLLRETFGEDDEGTGQNRTSSQDTAVAVTLERIYGILSRLDQKIDHSVERLEQKIDSSIALLSKDMDARLERKKNELLKWTVFVALTVAAIAVAIIGLLIKG